MLPRGMPTNLSAVQRAVNQEDPSVIALTTMVVVVIALIVKCTLRYVLTVAKSVKCPLSLEKAGQYIVVTAIGSTE